MNPFLTCSSLPHPLHRSAIRSPHRQPHRRWIWAIYAALKPSKTVEAIVRQNVARESRLMSDESSLYTKVGADFAAHETVTHSAGEYVRGDVHTNTIEGFFGLFKRGMKGIYQHCRETNLGRYLTEFEFRYNHRIAVGVDDVERTVAMIQSIRGKRLMYRDSYSVGV